MLYGGLVLAIGLYNCFKDKVSCVKVITDANGSGNVVNIKIHTDDESLAMVQQNVPLRELNSQARGKIAHVQSTANLKILFLRPNKT
jgi:hypothetical protein